MSRGGAGSGWDARCCLGGAGWRPDVAGVGEALGVHGVEGTQHGVEWPAVSCGVEEAHHVSAVLGVVPVGTVQAGVDDCQHR
jgi:hypothetical protein